MGPGLPSYSVNVVVERLVHCNNPAVLEALFLRLWDVAAQRDRAHVYAQRKMQRGGTGSQAAVGPGAIR